MDDFLTADGTQKRLFQIWQILYVLWKKETENQSSAGSIQGNRESRQFPRKSSQKEFPGKSMKQLCRRRLPCPMMSRLTRMWT
jgi:hypothetical protein